MKRFLICLVLAAMVCQAREKTLSPVSADEWLGGGETLTVDGSVFRISGSRILTSKAIMPIDVRKKYRVDGYFRLAAGSVNSRFYLGLVPMDEERRRIEAQHVQFLPGSDTGLSRQYQAEARELWIRNNTEWRTDRFHVVALATDASDGKKDLPNFKVSSGNVIRVETGEKESMIVLSHGMGESFAAGTAVRLHKLGPHYLYAFPRSAEVPKEWKNFSGIIHGDGGSEFGNRKFPTGTRNARVVILANYGQRDAVMEFKDITLTELPD